jgi:hypothetical protein
MNQMGWQNKMMEIYSPLKRGTFSGKRLFEQKNSSIGGDAKLKCSFLAT